MIMVFCQGLQPYSIRDKNSWEGSKILGMQRNLRERNRKVSRIRLKVLQTTMRTRMFHYTLDYWTVHILTEIELRGVNLQLAELIWINLSMPLEEALPLWLHEYIM